jgi:uncharacterized Tic20 family protein
MDIPVEPAANIPAEPAISREERMWGMLAHLSAFAGLLIPFLGHVLGPLVIWLIKRETMPFVNDQGKEALNFQITATIAFAIAGVLVFVAIGFLLLPLIAIADIIMTIIAAVKANEGVVYRYPLTLRLIK